MTFVKGQSGNPAGRKPKTKPLLELEYLAKKHAPEAIEILAKIMRGSDNDSSRVAAAKEMLDRAFGKSMQQQIIDMTVEDRSVIRAPEPLTMEEWEKEYGEQKTH